MVIADYIKEVETLDEIPCHNVGRYLPVCSGLSKGFIISSKQYVGRQIGEPILEPSVRGSRRVFRNT